MSDRRRSHEHDEEHDRAHQHQRTDEVQDDVAEVGHNHFVNMSLLFVLAIPALLPIFLRWRHETLNLHLLERGVAWAVVHVLRGRARQGDVRQGSCRPRHHGARLLHVVLCALLRGKFKKTDSFIINICMKLYVFFNYFEALDMPENPNALACLTSSL